MNLEDTKLREIIPGQRTNSVGLHVHDIPRVVRFTETEGSTVVARGWCGGRIGSYYLIGMEFQYGKMKKFWRWMVR